jgi:hypothetical protein
MTRVGSQRHGRWGDETYTLYLPRNPPISCDVVTLTHTAVTEGELQFQRLLIVECLLTTLVKDHNAARFIPVNE